MVLVGTLVAVGVAAAGIGLVAPTSVETGTRDADMEVAPAENLRPADVELPEIATEKPDLHTEAGLVHMWDVMLEHAPDGIQSMTIRPEWAEVRVLAETDRPGLASIRYEAGLATEPEWERSYSESEGSSIGWDDVTPEAVATAITGTADAVGRPGADTLHASVARGRWHGNEVTIHVVVEDEGQTFSATWDATGTTELSSQ